MYIILACGLSLIILYNSSYTIPISCKVRNLRTLLNLFRKIVCVKYEKL